MRHLPLELQHLVIENLGPKDIGSLQLVSELDMLCQHVPDSEFPESYRRASPFTI